MLRKLSFLELYYTVTGILRHLLRAYSDHELIFLLPDSALITRIENGDISQDDPELIDHLRKLILPPSSEPYAMKTDVEDTSIGQAAVINEVFKGKVQISYIVIKK